MDDPDAVAGFLHEFSRIAVVVDQHVGWVEVDADVGFAEVFQQLLQTLRRFGAGLKEKLLAAGYDEAKLTVETDYEALAQLVSDSDVPVFIL